MAIKDVGNRQQWVVIERAAPTAGNPNPAAITIDSVSTGLGSNFCNGLTVDGAGNVFAVGQLRSGIARVLSGEPREPLFGMQVATLAEKGEQPRPEETSIESEVRG